MKKVVLNCAPNPCNTCPYRKDTPPGIWAREEYDKLPKWDARENLATFLCHNDPNSVCRGWLEVHHENLGVRMQCFAIRWNDGNKKPTEVELYSSGAEARRAGLRGIKSPSQEARRRIKQIFAKRK